MTKFLRRQFWLISGFFSKYYKLVGSTIVISIIVGFIAISIYQRLPKPGRIIRIGLIGQYTSQTLPPLVKNILNSGLTRVEKNMTIAPNLAENWQVSEDGKNYTFTLKPNLRWTNDTAVKTSDILLNIPDVKIETQNPDKIIFHLPESYSPFPSALINPIIDKSGQTVSSYTVNLTQSTSGFLTRVTLTSPNETFIIRTFPNSSLALTAYKLGELDVIYNIPQTANENIKGYGQIRTVTNTNQAIVLFINNLDPVLKSKSIRQGLAYAISDKSLGFDRAIGPISKDSWAFNPLVKLYDYDETHAENLIHANLPDKSRTLNLELATTPTFLPIAEKIKANLNATLINLNIKVVSTRPDNYQLYLSSFDIPIDPDQYVYWHSTQTTNFTHTNNEKVDKALEDGRHQLDTTERKKTYNEFQRSFAEEIPSIFLFYPRFLGLSKNQQIFDLIPPESAL